MSVWQKRLLPVPFSVVLFIVLSLACSFWQALGFLMGAVVYWCGELCFIALLYPKIMKKRSRGFMWLFSLAELLKLLVFACVFVVMIKVLLFPLIFVFFGFIVNLLLFWILSFTALGNL